jgi:Tfp pilus assembly protein PilO
MKTRNWLTILLIVVLVVVYCLIITNYLKQRDYKQALEVQVADANAALALIPQPPTDLEQRLASAQDSLAAVKDSFTIDTNDTRILNGILEIAKKNGVKAIPLATQPWVSEISSNQSYVVFRIDLQVSGTYPQLVSFLNQLENSEPKTLIIENLSVDTASGSSLLNSSARDILPINAKIRIAIYSSPAATG